MASTPVTQPPRRSSSLPAGRLAPSSPDPQIEILFTLPSVRIISFTTSTKSSSRPGSSNGSIIVEDEPGTLSWVSRFERTIAVGPLRIYRAPGSVAFLNCANALQPILPKSQAWCVDGNSKFVLQIRPPQYWRIEVPNKTADESVMVEQFKKVLEQVLRYEKTACPFQRDFVVELPEKPATPIKKKPWRPIERPQGASSPKSSPLLQATTPDDSHTIAPIAELRPSTPCPAPEVSVTPKRPTSPPTPHRDPESPEPKSVSGTRQAIEAVEISNASGKSTPKPLERRAEPEPTILRSLKPSLLDTPEYEYIFGSYAGPDEESDSYSEATDDTDLTPKRSAQPQPVKTESDKGSKPQSIQNCNRSVTAPPFLPLTTSTPSKQRTNSPLRCSTTFETSSDCSSSAESFHSVQSWHSPLAPPSPPASEPSSPSSTYPYPHENIVLPKRKLHSRDVSELTVTLETPNIWERSNTENVRSTVRSLSPPPRTPPNLVHGGSEKSDEEHSEIATPPTIRPTVRHRATTSSNSRRRALSPLPAAVNLFSPPKQAQRRLRTARHLPTAIIQKTCEILLSPPSHLFQLMLSIASKIAAGEWRGMLSGHGEAVHWDFEDEYGADPSLYEDDFGISLAKSKNCKAVAKTSGANVTGGSWEVD